MRSLIIYTALVTAGAVSAAAQTATISGRVLNDQSSPLAGVTVVYNRIPELMTYANGQRIAIPPIVSSQVASDASGLFEIPALPAGFYHLCTVSSVPGQLSSCLYEPKPVCVVVAAGSQITGVQLTARTGTVVNIQVTDAAGHIRAGAPFAIGANAIGGTWSFFARFVSQSGQTLNYQMTLPKDYNFGLVVDTSLPVTDSNGLTVAAKQPGALLATSSSVPLSAAFVVN